MATVSMNFKTDAESKKQFDEVAQKLGLSSSALLNIFVKRVAKEKAIPFRVAVVSEKDDDQVEIPRAVMEEIAAYYVNKKTDGE
ncbi:type II toxin-antitoxin system RelB/DinJ family antitoxin [Limosilactobacillus mucosae]|nr:type II toxin-antitoxin system RelB/DinJ family antitoxin [Limosilactobacillus mucosae]MBN2900501.1 type II toxin-antitoxin system RelB/DinJ family antitoxin [Limosilactobacillus mucosae]QOL70367.1 type II toxin-antitoxin system RelB/DinJ family antitoxin [Limosilactobacillus mucosae]